MLENNVSLFSVHNMFNSCKVDIMIEMLSNFKVQNYLRVYNSVSYFKFKYNIHIKFGIISTYHSSYFNLYKIQHSYIIIVK